MKIAICGSHGVGKTTLAEALSKKLKLPLIKETAREVYALGLPLLSMVGYPSVRAQLAVFGLQLLREQQCSEFVSDRSILDGLAYFRVSYDEDDDIAHRYWTMLVEFGREYAKHNYDLLVYVPIEFELVPDGFRNLDGKLQSCIDAILCQLLRGIPHLRVSGSLEERVSQVLERIGGVK